MNQATPPLLSNNLLAAAPGALIGPDLTSSDLSTVLKAMQVISCQLDVEELLDKLVRVAIEHLGAQRACLLLTRNNDSGNLYLAVEAEVIDTKLRLALFDELQAPTAILPLPILQKICLSHEKVLIANAAQDPLFDLETAPDKRRQQTILCLPLLRQAKLIGILHLEQRDIATGFCAHRVALLELLLAQAVVSLENARLHRHLQEEDKKRKATEAAFSFERNLLRTLVDNLPDVIYAKDTESKFLFANKALAQLMGVGDYEELLGKNDFDFFDAELANKFYTDEQNLLQSGIPLIDHEEPTMNLVTRELGWMSTTKVHLHDNEGVVVGIVGIGHNITRRKQIEEELLHHNAALTELNTELTQAQEQLNQAEKLASLGALVAGIAHELNTPIGNGVMAASTLAQQTQTFASQYISGMKRAVLEEFIEDANHASDILMRNLLRAADLVASFKRVAVNQSSSQRRTFLLVNIVAEIILAMSPTIKKLPIALIQSIPSDLRMDSYPGPLGQVLINLLDNAMLHGFDGRASGTISIKAKTAEEGWLELTIQDNGVGIVEANINRIFDPFFTTKLGVGGSGLGLNITHNIVTVVLGGRIHVESTPPTGTIFTLTLPTVAPLKMEDGNSLLHA